MLADNRADLVFVSRGNRVHDLTVRFGETVGFPLRYKCKLRHAHGDPELLGQTAVSYTHLGDGGAAGSLGETA